MENFSRYENPELRRLLDDLLRPGGLELTKQALRLSAIQAGGHVLDLGCGPGKSLSLLQQAGYDAVGLDISAILCAKAGKIAPVVRADAMMLPFQDSSLDAVLLECVLSLLPDKRLTVSECLRVVKPGGKMILADLFVKDSGALFGDIQGVGNCLSGALTLPLLRGLLLDNGWNIFYESDYSNELVALTAQLVWRLGSVEALERLFGWIACPQKNSSGLSCSKPRYGYVLVLAMK